MTLCPGAKRNVVQTRGSLPEEGFRGFSRRPCWRAETVLHENRSYYLGETKSSNMAAMTSQENALYYCPLSTVIREFKQRRRDCLGRRPEVIFFIVLIKKRMRTVTQCQMQHVQDRPRPLSSDIAWQCACTLESKQWNITSGRRLRQPRRRCLSSLLFWYMKGR